MSITKFLIKKNVVRNEGQANMLMIFVILLCALYFIIKFSGNSEPQPQPLTEEEILMMEAEEMDFLQ